MSSKEVEPTARKWRKAVPEAHRTSLDTRIAWMWHQRFGTIQMIWKESPDLLDHTAAQLVLQAILEKDLGSIELILQRVEGGAQDDEIVMEPVLKM